MLIPNDYKAVITGNILNVITRNDSDVRGRAESAARDEMYGYLASRYDMAKVLSIPINFDGSAAYSKGDLVIDNGAYFYAIAVVPNNTLTSDTAYWKAGDNRNAAIKMYLVDISLYHIHANITPDNIPQIRYDRYTRAIEWLEGVAKGTITPNLPHLTDSDGADLVPTLIFGSNTKNKNLW